MTGTRPEQPERPLAVAELARALNVEHSALYRALRSDPAAPRPVETTDTGRPLYDRQEVTAWWPNRRRRGRPPASTPSPQEVRRGAR